MLSGFIWRDQYLFVRQLEPKTIYLHKISLKIPVKCGKIFPIWLTICVKFFIPKCFPFYNWTSFPTMKTDFTKLTLRRWIRHRGKRKQNPFSMHKTMPKDLCYLLIAYMAPFSFSVTNVPFKSYFEFYKTVLKTVCCFNLGS